MLNVNLKPLPFPSSYTLPGNANGKFRIDPRSGAITTATALDREVSTSYQLTAQATDGGSLALSGTTVVTVTVEDDNDNKPHFMQSRYTQYLRDPTNAGEYQTMEGSKGGY